LRIISNQDEDAAIEAAETTLAEGKTKAPVEASVLAHICFTMAFDLAILCCWSGYSALAEDLIRVRTS
jgi:hypothetical protein